MFNDIINRLEYICPGLNDPKRKYPITNNEYNWVILYFIRWKSLNDS